MTKTAAAPAPTIYTEVSGCTVYLGEDRGTTVGFTYTQNRTSGAFVRLDAGGMVYVATSLAPVGERGVHREILSRRSIDRDEFDRLNGIDRLRTELGWR